MKKTEKKTKFKSNQRGITLIALVITIIVLLILAGVAISMLSGENGILKKAADAKTSHEEAVKQEEQTLSSYEWNMAKYTEGTIANKLKVGDFVEFGYKNSDGTEADPIKWIVLYNNSTEGLQVMATDNIGTVTIGSDESLEAAIASVKNVSNILQAEANKCLNTKYALSARSIGSNSKDLSAMNTWDINTSILVSQNVKSFGCTVFPKYNLLTWEGTDEYSYFTLEGGREDDFGEYHKWSEIALEIVAYDREETENDEFFVKTPEFVPVFTLIPGLTIKSGEGTWDIPYELNV